MHRTRELELSYRGSFLIVEIEDLIHEQNIKVSSISEIQGEKMNPHSAITRHLLSFLWT